MDLFSREDVNNLERLPRALKLVEENLLGVLWTIFFFGLVGLSKQTVLFAHELMACSNKHQEFRVSGRVAMHHGIQSERPIQTQMKRSSYWCLKQKGEKRW